MMNVHHGSEDNRPLTTAVGRSATDGPDEVANFAYLAIRLARKSLRTDPSGQDASKADAAAKKRTDAVTSRLREYPISGPDRDIGYHSTDGQCDR